LRGWVKDFLTRSALTGFDVILCNARPIIQMIQRPYAEVTDWMAFARWGDGMRVSY